MGSRCSLFYWCSQPDTLVPTAALSLWDNHARFSEYTQLRWLCKFSLVIINMINHFNDFLYFRTITYSITDSVYIHVCLRNNYKAHNICKERKCKPRIFISTKTLQEFWTWRDSGNTVVFLRILQGSASANQEMIGEILGKGRRDREGISRKSWLTGSYTSIIVEIIF